MIKPSQIFRTFALFAATLAMFQAGPAEAQSVPVDFDSERWEIQRGGVTEHQGRKSFMGRAVLKDVDLENGVVEVDMAFNGAPWVRGHPVPHGVRPGVRELLPAPAQDPHAGCPAVHAGVQRFVGLATLQR